MRESRLATSAWLGLTAVTLCGAAHELGTVHKGLLSSCDCAISLRDGVLNELLTEWQYRPVVSQCYTEGTEPEGLVHRYLRITSMAGVTIRLL